MNRIPKIVHTCWFGDKPIPRRNADFVRGFLHKHPGWTHKHWNEFSVNMDALCPNIINWFDAPVEKSDAARLIALHSFGGVYIDMDVECVRPIDDLLNIDADAFVAKEDSSKYCNAVIGSCKHSYFIAKQVGELANMRSKGAGWGVGLLNETVKEVSGPNSGLNRLPFHEYPTDYFYPWLWDVSDPLEKIVKPNTYLIHHWDKSWWEK